jgi:phosphatidylglycerol:prolipoprotein diacylglycerol transferase
MGFAGQIAMVLAPVLRLGGMRFSAFGVCAILGLLAAFALMRWTSPMAGVAPEPLIDAGFFGVLAGLVVSRVLLVVQEPVAFLHYPLLILSLPSFTDLGMALTVVAVFIYLWRKRLPVLKVLDAWAPCAALLAAGLSVGSFLEGTHAGMPTTLPWGVLDPRFGRIHPVQMYAAVAAIWLCVLLLALLARAHGPGHVARTGLMTGGLAWFVLDWFRQPDPGAPHALLESGQWVALGAFAVGWLWSSRWTWTPPQWDANPVQIPPSDLSKETL